MPIRWLFALCCSGVILGGGAAFAGDQHSFLYPPEVRVRPIVVAIGGPWQRHYWDPRYTAVWACTPQRRRFCSTDRIAP